MHLDYKKELQSPHRLTKDEVADHLREYAARFNLNVILSSEIQSSFFGVPEKKWMINLSCPDDSRSKTIVSKHLVQATGLGSGKPYLPPAEGGDLYKGLNIHSTQYRNGQAMVEQGVKVRRRFTRFNVLNSWTPPAYS